MISMSKEIAPEAAYEQMRVHCLAKPGVTEDHPWGDVAWKRGKKAFVFGGEGSANFTLKSTPDRQSALVLHPKIRAAAYVGRFGWVTIQASDEETLALAKDLADESFDLVGPRRKSR